MSKRNYRRQAQHNDHHAAMAAFVAFLDGHWPLWRQHEGEPRYSDLRAAFLAGWKGK